MTEQEKLLDFLRLSVKDDSIVPTALNERSFQIFGDEKYMTSPEGKSLINKTLRKYHLNDVYLRVYKTPEPFVYVVTGEAENALIVENKDTFITMRKLLLDNKTILGRKFGALIYGSGRKIQSSFSYINKPDCKDLSHIKNFYYFGDIDAEGIDIFYKLKGKYKEYDIYAFKEGYRYLWLNRRKGRNKGKKRTQRIDRFEVRSLNVFTDEEAEEVYRFCLEGKIIPQEIVSKDILEECAA